jgi:Uma2 family endonuclease
MAEPVKKPMTAAEFLRWAEGSERRRSELFRGEIVAMAPERAQHGRAKAHIWRALTDAITRADAKCEAFVDSLGVAIDEHTVYEPDALVNCGARVAADSLLAPAPVVVVEVISPTSRSLDTNVKLADYFRLESVKHYLVVDTGRRLVLHYSRRDGEIAVTFVRDGVIALDPPGLTLALADIFPTVE